MEKMIKQVNEVEAANVGANLDGQHAQQERMLKRFKR